MAQALNVYEMITDKRFEDEESLKKYLAIHYSDILTREYSGVQLTTAAYVELLEPAGETIEFAAANAEVFIWQATDQVGTDGGVAVEFDYLDEDGVKHHFSGNLDDEDTTTEMAVATDFFRLASPIKIGVNVADEVLLGTTLGAAIYGGVLTGNWQSNMSRYRVPAGKRAFLINLEAIGPHTNPSSIRLTLQPKGAPAAILMSRDDYVSTQWYSNILVWELEEGSELIVEVKKIADANNGDMIVRFKVVEAG